MRSEVVCHFLPSRLTEDMEHEADACVLRVAEINLAKDVRMPPAGVRHYQGTVHNANPTSRCIVLRLVMLLPAAFPDGAAALVVAVELC